MLEQGLSIETVAKYTLLNLSIVKDIYENLVKKKNS